MTKKEAFKIVYDELTQCPMFCGKYDALHGSEDFMFGICTVMENIVINIDEDTYDEFSTLWVNNSLESLADAFGKRR